MVDHVSSLHFAVVLSFLGSVFLLRGLAPLATRFELIDIPGGRKTHGFPTPLIGGIATYIAVLLAAVLSNPLSAISMQLLIGSSLVLIVGMADDRKPLSVSLRLFFQCVAIGVVIYGTGLYVSHLPIPVFGGNFELGWFGIPFTLFAVIGLMNAFNLIDGIDGLAGSLALVCIAGIFSFASLHALAANNALVLLVGVALIPYLLHNLGIMGQKVFLGDAGSMFLGFVLAWSLIAQVEMLSPSISPSTVLWCVAVPVIDTFGVMARRVRKGRSPFKPGRDHLHHILLRAGLTPRMSLLAIVGSAITILGFGLIIETVAPNYSLVAFFSLFLVYNQALKHAWKVQKFLKG